MKKYFFIAIIMLFFVWLFVPIFCQAQFSGQTNPALGSWNLVFKIVRYSIAFIEIVSVICLAIGILLFLVSGGSEGTIATSGAFIAYAGLGFIACMIGYFILRYLETMVAGS